MSQTEACGPALVDKSDLQRCPVSGTVGASVDLVTLKALLTMSALRGLDGKAYRFCAEPSCDVVYFDRSAHSLFRKQDLSVRVGLKETEDPIPVCYCFGYTKADLRNDIANRGETDVPESIAAEIRAGHCACEVRNPEGSCCLGNVSKAITEISSVLRAATSSSGGTNVGRGAKKKMENRT